MDNVAKRVRKRRRIRLGDFTLPLLRLTLVLIIGCIVASFIYICVRLFTPSSIKGGWKSDNSLSIVFSDGYLIDSNNRYYYDYTISDSTLHITDHYGRLIDVPFSINGNTLSITYQGESLTLKRSNIDIKTWTNTVDSPSKNLKKIQSSTRPDEYEVLRASFVEYRLYPNGIYDVYSTDVRNTARLGAGIYCSDTESYRFFSYDDIQSDFTIERRGNYYVSNPLKGNSTLYNGYLVGDYLTSDGSQKYIFDENTLLIYDKDGVERFVYSLSKNLIYVYDNMEVIDTLFYVKTGSNTVSIYKDVFEFR